MNKLANKIHQTFRLFSQKNTIVNLGTVLTNSSRNLATKKYKNPFPQYENLPPISPLAQKGHTYETCIERKRVIEDPNLPSLSVRGPLKWATWRMLRDARRRRVFCEYQPFQYCYLNVKKCRMLPNYIREEAHVASRKLPKDSRIKMLHIRCAITGRSRGLLKAYRLSRLCWRDLADYNKLSGVIKACW